MKSRKQEIVDLAIEYIETRGVNAFSYNDISKQLEMTKASIHYHFPAKNDLIIAVIAQYRAQLDEVLGKIQSIKDAQKRLVAFFQNQYDILSTQSVCAIYSLEMNVLTLDVSIQEHVKAFVTDEKAALHMLISQIKEVSDTEVITLLSLFKGALVHRRIDEKTDVMQIMKKAITKL